MSKLSYRSNFEKWDEQAWIRTKPRRAGEFDPSKDFFSRDLSPLLNLDVVLNLGERPIHDILVYDLYRYLDFTVKLEMGPVNQVCSWLAGPTFLPWIPQQMKDDALRIYTDEAGHAEMSNTLIREVSRYTGITPIQTQPQFLTTLETLKDSWPEPYRVIIQLFFVIVSETLITGSLKRLPGDTRVQEQVRYLAADHASDEGKHHSYFRQLFFMVWSRLPLTLKERLVVVLPKIIRAFLEPDTAALLAVIELTSISDNGAAMVEELVRSDSVRQAVRDGASPTIKMLNQVEVLEIKGARHEFERNMLI